MNAVAVLLLCAAVQDVSWKKSWNEALAEAKKNNTLAVLVFFNDGVRDSKRFMAETLPDARVVAALRRHSCALIDPEGSDEDNRLWQQHKSPMPPSTIVYDPEGKLLTTVNRLGAKAYADALEAIGPAYFDKIVPARRDLEKDPENADRLAQLGEAYILLENPKESAGFFEKAVAALEKKGDSAGAIRILSGQLNAYYEAKWYEQARPCCRRLLQLDPTDKTGLGALASWVLGMADCNERKWADAISGLKAACEKYPKCDFLDKIMFSLASAYMYSGDKASALKLFDEIVMKFPESETANIARVQAEKLRK